MKKREKDPLLWQASSAETTESSRFNSDERLPFAPPLFAEKKAWSSGHKGTDFHGGSRVVPVVGLRFLNSPLCYYYLAVKEGERERDSVIVSNKNRLACISSLLLAQKNQFRQVVRVNDKVVNLSSTAALPVDDIWRN